MQRLFTTILLCFVLGHSAHAGIVPLKDLKGVWTFEVTQDIRFLSGKSVVFFRNNELFPTFETLMADPNMKK